MMDFWSALSSCQFGYMKMLQFREFFGQQTWSDPFSHFSLLKFVGWCCFSHPAWKTILGNIFHTENWETSPLSVASIWFHPAFVLICEVSHSITLGHVWFTASCDHSAVFFLDLTLPSPWGREALLHAAEEGAGNDGNPGVGRIKHDMIVWSRSYMNHVGMIEGSCKINHNHP